MMAASQAGWRGGVGSCGRFGRVRLAPLNAFLHCLMQPCHVRAPPQPSCFTWAVQWSLPHLLLGVCTHNMLRAVVCPGAPCTGVPTPHAQVRAQHVDVIHAWFCTNLDVYYELSSLVVLRSDKKLMNSKIMHNPGEGPCSINVHRSIELSMSYY